MTFIRLLPILLLIPALTMADSDKNFKIVQKQFKQGTAIAPLADMAIVIEGASALSEMPEFPLRENKLYLRHKLGPKEFQWGVGHVNVENFGKLHAFSLKSSHMKPAEVAMMRFYGSQNSKAFQDETDLYFDRDYIYSPRVPKLFFVKNGHWQVINETTLPGVITFEMGPEMDAASMDLDLKNRPKMVSPVKSNPYIVLFSAPNSLPIADIGVVEPGQSLNFKPQLVKVERDFRAPTTISVTLNDVQNARNLEETEVLYDKYTKELLEDTTSIDMSGFEDSYPPMKVAATLGLSDADDTYRTYVTLYKSKRSEAHDIYLDSKRGGVGEVDRALHKKLDSLEQLPARVMLMPSSFEKVYPNGDSSKPAEAVKFTFGAPHTRYDVAWSGVAENVDEETLYSWFAVHHAGMKVYLTMENNKPVWLKKDGLVVSRHHYRFSKIEFFVDGETHVGVGQFILPNYILEEPEVQAWLNRNAQVSSSSVAPVSSSSVEVAQEQKVDIDMSVFKEGVPRVVRDRIHGNVALIDSGTFRYKGSVVSLSPYAIMTTEMTQKLFKETMNALDSANRIEDHSTYKHPQKPVHNIDWESAQKVCKALGGDLPTEAQWEYAARAGENEGTPWALDSASNPGEYAVYKENSYEKNKKSDEYGPQQVSSRKPNAWGMYDMAGNVAEWTRDRYFMFSFIVEKSNPTGAMLGPDKIYKGGSWKDSEKYLNATYSDDEDPRYWSDWMGFRCVYPRSAIKE